VAAGEKVVVEGVQKVSDGAVVVPEPVPDETSEKAAQLAPRADTQ
jgi:hypothetical protein